MQELGRVCGREGRIVAGIWGPPEKVEFGTVFKALGDAMPDPPTSGGPFELSAPGKLEGLFEEAGLKVVESGEVNCPFNYPDFETFWRAMVASGPFQGTLRLISEEGLQSTLRDAVEAFRLDNGGFLIQPNAFKYVVATRR